MQTPRQPAVLAGMNARLFNNNWRPALEEIAFAAEQGFASIQFPGSEEGLDAQRLGAPPAQVGQALRAAGLTAVMEIIVRLRANGRTEGGATPTDLLHANLPAIDALGCACVHWHVVCPPTLTAAEILALESRLPPECAEGVALAARHGFRFGFEHNAPGNAPFVRPESCAALLAAVPGLRFVWDINHTPADQLGDYLALTPRMSMLHVSDTPLPHTNHHLPLGLGAIDFGRVFGELWARGFRGPAILEIGGLPLSGGYGRDTDEALIDSLARLRAASAP